MGFLRRLLGGSADGAEAADRAPWPRTRRRPPGTRPPGTRRGERLRPGALAAPRGRRRCGRHHTCSSELRYADRSWTPPRQGGERRAGGRPGQRRFLSTGAKPEHRGYPRPLPPITANTSSMTRRSRAAAPGGRAASSAPTPSSAVPIACSDPPTSPEIPSMPVSRDLRAGRRVAAGDRHGAGRRRRRAGRRPATGRAARDRRGRGAAARVGGDQAVVGAGSPAVFRFRARGPQEPPLPWSSPARRSPPWRGGVHDRSAYRSCRWSRSSARRAASSRRSESGLVPGGLVPGGRRHVRGHGAGSRRLGPVGRPAEQAPQEPHRRPQSWARMKARISSQALAEASANSSALRSKKLWGAPG